MSAHATTNAVGPVAVGGAGPAVTLADIAAGLARSTSPDQIPPGPGRRYVQLLATPAYEAWLIAWPQGTGLGLHDHGGSGAAIEVVRGRLRELFLTSDGAAVRWLDAGASVSLPADHVHEIVNEDADEAVSVHVYGPRLGGLGFWSGEEEIGA
jgi:hypothetical protein